MSELTLYTNAQSRGRIAHWMMEEVGQPYDTVWLDYASTMKAMPYLGINPMGKVPAITHNGAVVTEAAAICCYLADAFPQAKLMPLDAAGRAAFFRWMFFTAGPLEYAASSKAMGWEVAPGRSSQIGFGSFEITLQTLENHLASTSYICGDTFSAADVYVGSHLNWGMAFGTMPKRAAFEAYVARLNTRPAALRADAINNEQLAQKAK